MTSVHYVVLFLFLDRLLDEEYELLDDNDISKVVERNAVTNAVVDNIKNVMNGNHFRKAVQKNMLLIGVLVNRTNKSLKAHGLLNIV